MQILFRWLFWHGLLRLAGTAVIVMGIFLIVELFDKSRLLGHGMNASLLAEYLLLKTPMMLAELMPVIALLGSSMLLLELSMHHEIVAMRAAGLGLGCILPPLLTLAMLAGALEFALQEWVTPTTNQRLDVMERVYVHHKAAREHGVQWLRDGSRMFRLTPLDQRYFSVMMLETDARGRWLQRMDAKRAHYAHGYWQLQDVDISQPDEKEGMILHHKASVRLPSSASPDAAEPPRASHMQFFELADYVRLLAASGMKNSGYVYALHRKLAAPLGALIMVLLAAALCMNMGARLAARSMGIAATIALGLLFYALGNVMAMLAGSERLPPAFAAWMPLLFFGGLAVFLLMHREQLS